MPASNAPQAMAMRTPRPVADLSRADCRPRRLPSVSPTAGEAVGKAKRVEWAMKFAVLTAYSGLACLRF